MIDKEDAESSWNSLVRNSPMIKYKFAFKPNAVWSQMWEMPWKWLESFCKSFIFSVFMPLASF